VLSALPLPFSGWPTTNNRDFDSGTHTNCQPDTPGHGGNLHSQLPMTGSLYCLSQCQCNDAGVAEGVLIIDLSYRRSS